MAGVNPGDGQSPPAGKGVSLPGFVERHQRTVLVCWTLLLLILLLGVAEAVLRRASGNRGEYYIGHIVSKRLIRYPFGDMPFNSDGYPDHDWNPADSRERVGFWGDSITSGVGAGFGYRYTDLIAARRNDRYYLNFGGPGEDGIADDRAIQRILGIVEHFALKKVVYGMDLNDILPDKGAVVAGGSALRWVKPLVKHYLDVLRTRSYLYDYLRTQLTNLVMRLGYGYHGDEAFELYPERHAEVVGQTIARINHLAQALQARGVALCVAIFPYEMQVSADAAARYRSDGIRWSASLLQGEPQRMLLSGLAPSVVAVDLAPAFRKDGAGHPIGVGEYFVFNQGDVLDWVHPNRAGHRLVADYLLQSAPSCL